MIRNFFIGLLLLISPVLSAQQQDSIKPRILKQWTLSSDFTEEVVVPFDTVFSLFNRYRLADRYSPFNAGMGNYGLPFYQLNFFDRISDPERFLYSSYYPLMYVPGRSLFMNTQVPFTELVWTFGGPRDIAEQTFRIRHSQNVNRFLNFGLIYDIVYSLGQYSYQRAENKDFTLFSSYTGKRYKLYFSWGLNNITSNENGGIPDFAQLSEYETREVEVNMGALNKSKSFLKNNNLLLVQRYTIGKKNLTVGDSLSAVKSGNFRLSGTFSHIFTVEGNKRTYSDNSPLSGFYDTAFISSSVTFDSLSARSVRNTLRFDFKTDESRRFRLGGGVGIRNEILRYSQIVPTHNTTVADTAVWRKGNNAFIGKLYNNIGDKFQWVATGELYLSGYRAGDFELDGVIKKSFDFKRGPASWEVTGGILNRQPSFWYEHWGSNHFEWYNNIRKELRLDIGTKFSFPARNGELSLNYAVIDNYTDFGPEALPSQHPGGLSVISAAIHKGLIAWKFHLDNDILLQQSSNRDVLDLPLFTIRSAFYFEHLFRFESTNGRLNTQLGADVTYHTSYHPYSYMPSTGRFYRQDEVTAGNYPFVNVFLNIKLKRTRIFLMFDHVNAGLMGYDYYMIPSYPMNFRMFRYGIAWTFYD